MQDTIFAQATARGKAGVSVIRISGSLACAAAAALGASDLRPHRASLRQLMAGGEVIDEAVVIWFPEGKSFTGEDVVELQVHGSVAVIARLTEVLAGMGGLRLAEPGEFTRRALADGRMDLTQVEALADLIDAETEAQRKQAQRILSGQIGRKVEDWRARLVRASALIEATIDFAEEDVPEDVVPEVVTLLEGLKSIFETELAGIGVAERVREGFEVAIIGSPNAGKSSLLNALAGRKAAITSAIAGTTRDVIEVRMDLLGLPVTFLDTAGLRDAEDEVERMGVALARERAAGADLRLLLVDPGQPTPDVELEANDLRVVVKADLYPEQGMICSLTGEGLPELMEKIHGILSQRAASAGVLVRDRHRQAIKDAISALDLVLGSLYARTDDLELVAEDLHRARRALERLVGRIDIEDLLGEIFSSFCIGK